MSWLDLLNHLLNFVAPAWFVAAVVTVGARWVSRGGVARPRSIWARWAINGGVGTLVLWFGLVVFGRDGKMATYGALVLAVATSQWFLQRQART